MGKSYGLIEITGVVAAMDALDIMCKSADVTLSTWERKLGGRLVTIIVEGEVAAVTAAVEAARTQALKPLAAGSARWPRRYFHNDPGLPGTYPQKYEVFSLRTG